MKWMPVDGTGEKVNKSELKWMKVDTMDGDGKCASTFDAVFFELNTIDIFQLQS